MTGPSQVWQMELRRRLARRSRTALASSRALHRDLLLLDRLAEQGAVHSSTSAEAGVLASATTAAISVPGGAGTKAAR